MRNPQIDTTELVEKLGAQSETMYAGILEDATAYLNSGEERLRQQDVIDLKRGARELGNSTNPVENQIGSELKDFVARYE